MKINIIPSKEEIIEEVGETDNNTIEKIQSEVALPMYAHFDMTASPMPKGHNRSSIIRSAAQYLTSIMKG